MINRLLIGGPANGQIIGLESERMSVLIPVCDPVPLTWKQEDEPIVRPSWHAVEYRLQTVIDGKCKIDVMVDASVGLWSNGKALAHVLELAETMPEVMLMMDPVEETHPA